MRVRLNTAVNQLNSQLVAVAKQVHIDIVSPDDLNAAFNGYRFCESNSNVPWLFDEIENELSGAPQNAYGTNDDGGASGGVANRLTSLWDERMLIRENSKVPPPPLRA